MVPLISFRSVFRRSLLTIAGLAVFINVVIPVDVAQAAPPSAFEFMSTQTERWMRMRGVYGCLYEKGLPYNDSGQVMEGHFANNGATAIGYLNDDGKVSCNDGAFITNSNSKIGFEGNDYSYCAAQPSSYRTGGPDTDSTSDIAGCVGGSGSFNNAADHKQIASQWLTGLKSQVTDYRDFMTDSGGQTDQSKYYMYYQSLLTFCGAVQDTEYGGTDREKSQVSGDKRKVVINVVTGTGEVQPYVFTLDRDQTDKIDDVYQEMSADSKDLSCEYMAERTWELDDATAAWVKQYNFNFPDANTEGGLSGAREPGTEPTSTCVIDGVGWIICASANFMAKLVDSIYNIIEIMLRVQPLQVDTSDGKNAVYNVWSQMRSIANVLFVIAFMVIIYSQLTSAGISNYGIKKLLPRLAVAAIMVNISYWVCAIAVDISNILGTSIHSMLVSAREGMNISIDINWATITTALLSGATLALAIVGGKAAISSGAIPTGAGEAIAQGAMYLMIPILVAVVIAIFVALFVLVARQALIVILILLSPLAFVALLLPNTDKFFDLWRKTFITMLLLYPIISLLFGGAAIAGLSIIAAAADGEGDGVQQPILILTGMAVMVIPLGITPLLVKFSGNLGRYAGVLKGKGNGIAKWSRSRGREKMGLGVNKFKYGEGADGKTMVSQKFERGNRIRGAFGAFARRGDQNKAADASASKLLGAVRDGAIRERIANDEDYALASAAGASSNVDLIRAYARQGDEKSYHEDLAAQRDKIRDKSPATFVKDMEALYDSGTEAELGAYASEIAARGAGEDFHAAMVSSQRITDHKKRERVQEALMKNIREDHYGLSDAMRSKLGTGDLDENFQITDQVFDEAGNEVVDANGEKVRQVRMAHGGASFDNVYDASLDQRLEVKSSANSVVTMKPHDMNASKNLMKKKQLSNGALKAILAKMTEAERTPQYAGQIKGETKAFFDEARKLATERGLAADGTVLQAAPAVPATPTPADEGRINIRIKGRDNP